ncbi:maleylpyruvate isomerase family mycothiol-dependent enzyme [Modestobacter sp. Leaf380]|uniref:maleylpyruvate isomerase family mycothiol-dependent enzyme n=1 Tax=Modestobacter sp. Leaf380 TaxID=1736356 RepID=UPI0012FCAC12|nr:maleylpyruvate isomerase family mycothiol-dependent enzyme [Modestobacter sp. Leaf380]
MSAVVGDVPLDRLVDAVVADGERFGVVAELLDNGRTPVQGGLDVTVPWVPDWTARDLVVHLGTVHRWVTGILRSPDPTPPPAPRFPPHEDLHGWFALGLTELVATLRTTDPVKPTWHMSPAADTAGHWVHRQASEHLVHRLDLETAAGLDHAPVDPALAADGVAELLGVVLPRWAHTEPLLTARAHVLVRATDLDTSWDVGLRDGAVTVGTSAEPDAVLSGTAEQLLRRLWGRPAEVEVSGDATAETLLRGR